MILFLGDFHHNRNSINITTMDYSLRLLEKLDATGLRTMFIPGNHDLYHKDKRTLNSIKYISKFKNIQLINDQYSEDSVASITEVGFGLQYDFVMGATAANVRLGVEGQYWAGLSGGFTSESFSDSENVGLAGFLLGANFKF